MEPFVKKGCLNVSVTGAGNVQTWQQRFYVLNSFTSTMKARLDCYETERSFDAGQPPQHTYCIDDIATIKNSEKPGHTLDYKYTFEIVYSPSNKALLFSADSSEDMKQWLMVIMASKFESEQRQKEEECSATNNLENISLQNCIYESIETELPYMVEIEETESSRRCNFHRNKTYELHIYPCHLRLVDPETKSVVDDWPYRFIRRYGHSTSQFSIEAGRRCNSGAGLFNFKTTMADKLFSDVQDRTTAMRENQQEGNSIETAVDNHVKPSPAVQRAAKPIVTTPALKPVCVHPAATLPSNGRSVRSEGGTVREKVRSFQDSTDSVPITIQTHPPAVNPSIKEKTDARPNPPVHVPSKEEKERRMKDMTKLHREMAQKAEKTKHHHHLKTAMDAISVIASDVLLHSRKSEPPPKLPEPNDAPHVMPIQLRSRGLPSLPKESVESPDAAEYDVAYSQPRDNEYSEPYTEIPQGTVVEQPNDSDSYTYAAVPQPGRLDVHFKMSAVAADMSRNRCHLPSPQSNSDTYDYLDFVGVPGAAAKDSPKSSGHIYGHLSVAETEDEAGYADPVFLNEPPSQKASKK